MKEFFKLISPKEAKKKYFEQYSPHTTSEIVETRNALNRVTAAAVAAPYSLPSFNRSTVDGFAVKAQDTYGASESLPCYLNKVGEVMMGREPEFSVNSTECALIHTGGMLPQGTDAVLMLEYSQITGINEIEIMRSAAVGENVIRIGEDIKQGEELVPSGKRIREAEIGGLMAMGITEISVIKIPKIGIISSGDEIVPPENNLSPGQVRDINSYSLFAIIEQNSCDPIMYGIVPDNPEDLLATASRALSECDMVLITAGSSVSHRDITAQVINQLGEPGVLVHGVNIRPGKPTILGICNKKAVIGLPGNPVSAFVISKLFVVPILERVSGISYQRHVPMINAELTVNLSSQSGREDWVPVKLTLQDSGILNAEPVFGKSNLIFTLVKCDGLVCIPADETGIGAGEKVEVQLL